eukprot:CAMPEP_0206456624 /NCGR_PEP_ID=MMETSP0324_2-20121206/22479_1 /ASSEMBLY_ACC=CAM_ASM_000836 /TAXON_ID=2866 /ORGANISM="Crypthecodinium cohnii, Strain Seligo" /LENGTH=286 /DNA_ID=CAMNT_0053927595 /DNA_START=57 /DNA_END=917 /DNA_ORIENTATION=+
MSEECPERTMHPACDEQLGGLMPILVANRCAQFADVWMQLARALEGTDLVASAAAVAQMKASLKQLDTLTESVDSELARRKQFAECQEQAKKRIEDAMNVVRKDVGQLGDALFAGSSLQVVTEDVDALISSLVEDERREAARRALAAAVSPIDGTLPHGAALRSALELGRQAKLPDEELQPAYDALANEQKRATARQALARALTPTPEHRNVEDIGASLEAARAAGVSPQEIEAAEEALREGQKSSIWYDIISIIAEDPTEGDAGAGSGDLLAGLMGLPPAEEAAA